MSASAVAAAPAAAEENPYLEDLPDAIERLIEMVKEDTDPRDDTVRDLVEGLSIAWLAAERLRIERSQAAMARVNEH